MNTERIKKVTERIEKDEGRMNLSLYMAEVIEELKDDSTRRYIHIPAHCIPLRHFPATPCR